MKKSLLSVLASGLVVTAVAPVALAQNEGEHRDATTPITGKDVFGPNANELTQYGKDGLNNVDYKTTPADFKKAGEKLVPKKDADGKVIPGEFVVEGKAKAPAAKAGQKTLPKTHAVK